MTEKQLYLEEGFPFHTRKLEQIKNFLQQFHLTYDTQIQYSVLLKTTSGTIAGCGSRHENILKCIAVNPDFQGSGCLQIIITKLIKNAFEHGISHLFLFTKPIYQQMFSDMGFYTITQTSDMLLMENRKNGILQYLEKESAPFQKHTEADVGSIVMNANPFTNGHKYLVETAAQKCSILHIFVLSTDFSEFPSDIRLNLVKQGCAHLSNVFIHGSSDYLISHATFPDYFLKDKATVTEKTAVLDLQIFGTYFKEAFHITKRFIGEEPFSIITRKYNEQMKKILPTFNIQVTEIPRYKKNNTVISASLVRQQFLNGDFSSLKDFVPETTYTFLTSSEGKKLQNHLLTKGVSL